MQKDHCKRLTMVIDSNIERKIRDASVLTPDPDRAERNLIRFFESLPESTSYIIYIEEIARLFSISQFLANYSISFPEELLDALKSIKKSVSRESVQNSAAETLIADATVEPEEWMRTVRNFKKRFLLRITLRDVLTEADFITSMDELTVLAEVILEATLKYSVTLCRNKYGTPSSGNGIILIGLGKLGGAELNYSSDVDIMGLYDAPPTEQTSGVLSPTGVRYNRISNHEFYCKVMETLNRLLSMQTEDGIAYRVDLRLRPQGQRGDLANSLQLCKEYYESWGRTWERMVMIRARPVAGDSALAEEFLDVINTFVWKRTVDYTEIEEIKTMKKKIDSTFSRDDIKRGYGGIREAEFFVQTLQLMYGGEHRPLRTHRLFNAIQSLRWMKLIPDEDLTRLWENYLYLRRLEHYLQMKDDLQIHKLPTDSRETEILAKKMGYKGAEEFLMDLRLRRMQIKSMYNSLLGSEEDIHAEALTLLEGDLRDEEIRGYLEFRRVQSPDRGAKSLGKIRQQMDLFKTQTERSLMRRVIPFFLEEALRSENPDRALSGIEQFFSSFGSKGVYLQWFSEQKRFIKGIVRMFALSSYLTRIFLSEQRYLDILIEETVIRKSLRYLNQQISRYCAREGDFSSLLAEHKRFEEFRLGLFYLMGILTLEELMRFITHLAEASINAALKETDDKDGLVIVGMGKLGGREMNFGSDLDILFVEEKNEGIKKAERVIKALTTYTDRGPAYMVDVRLRPDGSKGTLVKNLDGYRNYYLKNAQLWEVQSLIKARPLTGEPEEKTIFLEMASEVMRQRGDELTLDVIKQMRDRIVTEVSHEQEGIDIKFGPGGIEDIEFYVQYLQIKDLKKAPFLMVQNSTVAMKRLKRAGLVEEAVVEQLMRAYRYFRTIEVFLRLNEESVIKPEGEVTEMLWRLMREESREEFLKKVVRLRDDVQTIIN